MLHGLVDQLSATKEEGFQLKTDADKRGAMRDANIATCVPHYTSKYVESLIAGSTGTDSPDKQVISECATCFCDLKNYV